MSDGIAIGTKALEVRVRRQIFVRLDRFQITELFKLYLKNLTKEAQIGSF